MRRDYSHPYDSRRHARRARRSHEQKLRRARLRKQVLRERHAENVRYSLGAKMLKLAKRMLRPVAAEKERKRLEVQRVVRKMTNWQRSQWGRAGYPAERVREFVELRRRA